MNHMSKAGQTLRPPRPTHGTMVLFPVRQEGPESGGHRSFLPAATLSWFPMLQG